MKIFAFLLGLFFVLFSCKRSAPLQRPNIIYISTDQQSASMMSCAGNEWLKTPAMKIPEGVSREAFFSSYCPPLPSNFEPQEGFKYIRSDAEGEEEQLLNLNKDPYETTHFTADPAYAEKLDYLRGEFDRKWFQGF